MRYLVSAIALLLAPMASAAPIVSWSPAPPTDIALPPTQTVITLSVDPFDTPLSGLSLTFTSPDPDLVIVAVAAIDPAITPFGPALNSGTWEATLAGFFLPPRGTNIVVGTVTVEGFTPGTQLLLDGELTDSLGNPISILPTIVATVVPEPGTLGLLSLGIAAIAAVGRRPR